MPFLFIKELFYKMTFVFTDASSAILLEKTKLFKPLLRAFKLVLATSVFYEITKPGYPGASTFTAACGQDQFVVRHPLENQPFNADIDKARLDRGERDTICLFLEKKEGFILIDDGKAARWCDKNHLPFINALLVPKIFWYAGLITKKECINKMNALCNIGRYSEKIKKVAFNSTLKNLSFFVPKN